MQRITNQYNEVSFKQVSTLIDTGMNSQSNYQFTVICYLSQQRGLTANKHDICEALQKANKKDNKASKFYMNVPVWNVLKKKNIINIEKLQITLNVDLTKDQRERLSSKCKEFM